jgi:spore maturation protein A
MNKIWVILILFCFVYGLIDGNADKMAMAVLNVPGKALTLVLKLGGLIIFYNGLFQVAIESGLIQNLSRKLKNFTRWLFPDLPKDSPAYEYICANLAANFLGLGLASTPMALKAMKQMKEDSKNTESATPSMVKLLLLNISCFTMFPVTMLGIRELYGATINLELVPFIILGTLILSVTALFLDKLAGKS